MTRAEIICDFLGSQRGLTKWYLKKIPIEEMGSKINVEGRELNSPLWITGHLVWTDYHMGLLPLGFKGEAPSWSKSIGFGSSGDIPSDLPDFPELKKQLDSVHEIKIDYLRQLSDEALDAPYAIESMGFKNTYHALMHLARHEGVHCGQLSVFCKFKGIRTV